MVEKPVSPIDSQSSAVWTQGFVSPKPGFGQYSQPQIGVRPIDI